jgi:regulator of RNase E activity RraA
MPPFLRFETEPKQYRGRVATLSVFGGTEVLDEALRNGCQDRVVMIDAQSQTLTSFFGQAQLAHALAGKVRAIVVFGAICGVSKLKEASIPIIAMGVTPRMAPSDRGTLIRHHFMTEIGPIQDEGPGNGQPGDYIVGSENGHVICKTTDYARVFGENAL